MLKKIAAFLILSSVAFAHGYRGFHGGHEYLPYPYYRPYYVPYGPIVVGGLAAGVTGYIIGSEMNENNKKIECQDFPVTAQVEGKPTIVYIKKCRVNNGPWQIPQ